MKRKLTVLICCFTVLTSSLPVYAAEKPQDAVVVQADINDQVSTQSEYAMGYYKVVGTGVRFRSSPGLSGSIIATLTNGEYLFYERAAGPTVEADGYTWLRCERYDTGQIGYVAVNYITGPVTPPPGAPNRIVNWDK